MRADLHRYLEMHCDMYKGGPFGKFYDVLLKKGSWYDAHGDWTGGFPQMKPKECFSNAIDLALKKGMLYCEGIALSSDLGVPMNHAWCVDAGGEVVDPTWRPRNSIFYGVGLVFEPKKALSYFSKQGFYGLIPEMFTQYTGDRFEKFLEEEFGS